MRWEAGNYQQLVAESSLSSFGNNRIHFFKSTAGELHHWIRLLSLIKLQFNSTSSTLRNASKREWKKWINERLTSVMHSKLFLASHHLRRCNRVSHSLQRHNTNKNKREILLRLNESVEWGCELMMCQCNLRFDGSIQPSGRYKSIALAHRKQSTVGFSCFTLPRAKNSTKVSRQMLWIAETIDASNKPNLWPRWQLQILDSFSNIAESIFYRLALLFFSSSSGSRTKNLRQACKQRETESERERAVISWN